jgi:hypothetical protein
MVFVVQLLSDVIGNLSNLTIGHASYQKVCPNGRGDEPISHIETFYVGGTSEFIVVTGELKEV